MPNDPALRGVYLAAPLFTLLERRANRALAEALGEAAPDLRVLLPQDLKPHGKFNDPKAFGLIFRSCLEMLASADAVLAWLDGPDADSGTCFEVGYAFAKGIPVVGLRTDFRQNQERGVNIMLSRACAAFVYRPSFAEDVAGLAQDVARALRKVLPEKKASPGVLPLGQSGPKGIPTGHPDKSGHAPTCRDTRR